MVQSADTVNLYVKSVDCSQFHAKHTCLFLCHLHSVLVQSRTRRSQASQELRDREGVEKDLSAVKAWIQETRELLLNPTPDIDSLLQELEVISQPCQNSNNHMQITNNLHVYIH